MKKFFELAVTSRKNVNTKVFLTTDVMSDNDEKLGQFDVKVLNLESHGGIFVKYTPAENCDLKSDISSLIFSGEDETKILEMLMILKDALLDCSKKSLSSKSGHDAFFSSLTYLELATSISLEEKKFTLPRLLLLSMDLHINNELISSLFGDEWLGIEVYVDSKLQSKIDEVAKAKRKEKEAEEKFVEEFMQRLATGFSSEEDD